MLRKKISLKGRIVFFALTIFTVYSVVSFVMINQTIGNREQQLEQLTDEIEQIRRENESLENLVENGMDPEYLIKIARERLGYMFPSERIYEDVKGK